MSDIMFHRFSSALEALFAAALLFLVAEFWRPAVVQKDINLVLVFGVIFVVLVLIILARKGHPKLSAMRWLVVLLLNAILLVVPGISLATRLAAILVCGAGSYLFLRQE